MTILLNEQVVRSQLEAKNFTKPFQFYMFETVNSTNQFLKELAKNSFIDGLSICCAEEQTEGRGRFGRDWTSPFGENIYCSGFWRIPCCLSKLSGLSLVVGLAILKVLQEIDVNQDFRIKWPNDILWGNKKVCGILIELLTLEKDSSEVIIGIGMNVNTATDITPLSKKPCCSLYDIIGRQFNRNFLLANVIYHVDLYLERLAKQGFSDFITDWQAVNYLQGKPITVSGTCGHISGWVCGITETGELTLRDKQGKTHYLSYGSASIEVF